MSKIDEICKIKYIEQRTPEELMLEYKSLRTQSDQAAFINAINTSGIYCAIFDFLTLAPFYKTKFQTFYKMNGSHGTTNYFVEHRGKLTAEFKPYDKNPYKADDNHSYKTAALVDFIRA
ncbi:MAG: hypothetical protein RL154_1051 [Pseudomonadota bacterium]|jgi:hypothetical protein